MKMKSILLSIFLALLFCKYSFCQYYPWGWMSWKEPVANVAALPASGNTPGDARVTFSSGNIYTWNGTIWVDQSGSGSVVPGGANTDVQYNNAGSFGGNANFTYDGSSLVTLSNSSSAAKIEVSGHGSSALVVNDNSGANSDVLEFQNSGTPSYDIGTVPGTLTIFDDTTGNSVLAWDSSDDATMQNIGGAPAPALTLNDNGGNGAMKANGNTVTTGQASAATLALQSGATLQATLTSTVFGRNYPVFQDQTNVGPNTDIWYSDPTDDFNVARVFSAGSELSVPGGAGPTDPWIILNLTDYFNQAGFYETTGNGIGLELEGNTVFEANNTGSPGSLTFSNNFNVMYNGQFSASGGSDFEGVNSAGNIMTINSAGAAESVYMGEITSSPPPATAAQDGAYLYPYNHFLYLATQFGVQFSPIVTQDLGADHIVISPQANGHTPTTTEDGAMALTTASGTSAHILCVYRGNGVTGWYQASDGVTPCTF